ncbi:MAG: hypothetical protein IKO35_04810 [Elusimicrobiaceae bacterium]|nr:hypothetical protein [Elusimicrobiaceae bacterium]
MLKKKFIILPVLILFTMATYAQRPPFPFKKNPFFQHTKSTVSISQKLQQRVQRTYRQVLTAQQNYPLALSTYGIAATKKANVCLKANCQDLYPNVPFLNNSKQLTNYFIARQNREALKVLPQMQRHAEIVQKRTEDFVQAQKPIDISMEQAMPWLAGQISDKTQYLFLGEMHGFPVIQEQIVRLLRELKIQHPQRHIILFSEFFPENLNQAEIVEIPVGLLRYLSIYQTALQLQIPVVGLEPDFVLKNWTATIRSHPDGDRESPVAWSAWAALEGDRLRSEKWLDTLARYREQYPDALFVVHTGAGHVDYSQPYSLAKKFQGPFTLVANFYPQQIKRNNQLTHNTTAFDVLTQGQLATQAILQFEDDALSKLAGFDVQFKIPNPVEPPLHVDNEVSFAFHE